MRTVCYRLLDRLLPWTNKRFLPSDRLLFAYRENRRPTNGKSDFGKERLLDRLLNPLSEPERSSWRSAPGSSSLWARPGGADKRTPSGCHGPKEPEGVDYRSARASMVATLAFGSSSLAKRTEMMWPRR